MNNLQLTLQLFLQVAVILLVCRGVGRLASHLGQPQVVAEMLAGILLGPSLFGLVWPEMQQWLFPWDPTQSTRDTQSYLYPLSQLGLALYMFVVGMEFRVDVVRKQLSGAVAVSVAGIVAPLVCGAGLGWVFFEYTTLFPSGTSRLVGMLFLGASMSITALPVLARIIDYKKLNGTTIGSVSLGAGAMGDAAAWCLLAFVLAALGSHWSHALLNVGGGVAYALCALLVIKPALQRWQGWWVREGTLTETGFVVMLALMVTGAWFTDWIGLHAVLGAFLMGAAMPKGTVRRELIARIQPLTLALLLPLFFTYSGLNTKMTLLNSAVLWLLSGVVLLTAIVCKAGACWLAARASGLPHREALGIGILMNARGLMELIIINIGLQRGIISPELFAILIIMAVATTLMTSPLFEKLVRSGRQPILEEPERDISADTALQPIR